jgi:hypothetical protein
MPHEKTPTQSTSTILSGDPFMTKILSLKFYRKKAQPARPREKGKFTEVHRAKNVFGFKGSG